MIGMESKILNATSGIVINGEYILWNTWAQGDLYKTYLCDFHSEIAGMPVLKGHYRGAFSCMIENDGKVYMISLFDTYEIMEYDISTGKIRMLYQRLVKGLQVFQAFLIDGKIYLFPSSLKEAVCIYSIDNGKVKYIAWESLFIGEKFSFADSRMYFMDMDLLDNTVYGVIYNSPYIIKIELEPIRCKIYKIERGYKAISIGVHCRKKYIILAGQNKFACQNEDGEIKYYDFNVCEPWGLFPYFSITVKSESILLLPSSIEDKIKIINEKTGEQREVPYPHEFRKVEEGRIFWAPVIYKQKIYLLPHCGNGLLVFDWFTYELKFVEWNVTRGDFLYRLFMAQQDKRKESKKNRGKYIYSKIKEDKWTL